jgi:hypothetical protein
MIVQLLSNRSETREEFDSAGAEETWWIQAPPIK